MSPAANLAALAVAVVIAYWVPRRIFAMCIAEDLKRISLLGVLCSAFELLAMGAVAVTILFNLQGQPISLPLLNTGFPPGVAVVGVGVFAFLYSLFTVTQDISKMDIAAHLKEMQKVEAIKKTTP